MICECGAYAMLLEQLDLEFGSIEVGPNDQFESFLKWNCSFVRLLLYLAQWSSGIWRGPYKREAFIFKELYPSAIDSPDFIW